MAANIRAEMMELVKAHAALDEPMETAIWIKQDDRDAWLVEVLPEMAGDAHPERPVVFNPGLTFRHSLHLIASNMDGLKRAITVDPELARAIADGEVLHGSELGNVLVELARASHGDVAAG